MDIEDTRKCNICNLEMLANYMKVSSNTVINYYDELLNDYEFLNAVNKKVSEIRDKTGFRKGIFAMQSIPSVDWFAFERVLIYVLIIETGVYYGGNSSFALLALKRNKNGKLVSIDYPDSEIRVKGTSAPRHSLVGDSELYDSTLRPGFMVPSELYKHWELIEGDSLKVIPCLHNSFDFYIHDSDHSMPFLSQELTAAWGKLSAHATILVDDIDWSNAFYAFCVEHRLFPLLMTDNGKDNLRVRTGIAMCDHPRNSSELFT